MIMKILDFIRKKENYVKYGIPLLLFLVGLSLPSPFFRGKKILLQKEVFVELSDTTNMSLGEGIYNGTVKKGTSIRYGYGKYEIKGESYEGEWKDDLLPYGIRTNKSYVYKGRFNKELENHGFGIAEYTSEYVKKKQQQGNKDSDVFKQYIGNWKNDKKEGLGRSIMNDGMMVFGSYSNGVLQRADGANFRIGGCVYGIDVSSHQSYIDWDNLAIYCNSNGMACETPPSGTNYLQPVFFAYIKATEGATYKYDYYNIRTIEAERHGIVKGAYHFLRLTSKVEDQLKNFFETATWTKGDLPPALDIEYEHEITKYGEDVFYDTVIKWLQGVEKKMGVKPVIYTNENIRNKYINDERLKGYDVWIAKYGGEPENFDWIIRQVYEHGKIKGNKGIIDINLYKGDYNAFEKYINGLEMEVND